MRVEYALSTAGAPAAIPATDARRRLDRFEWLLLGLFAAVSVWVLALDLWEVVANGRVWTGTDGFFVVDQMQYLAWVRDASHHVLASNLFVLRPTSADYFQPALAISGGLSALGMAPWLSLLLWKPVAVLGTFFATRAFVYRFLHSRFQRRIGLTLGLFFGSFSVVYGTFGVIGDLLPGFLSWGYPFGLMATAAMVVALLTYETDRRTGRVRWLAPLMGAVASSLHPWQGELLILVILAGEAASWRGRLPLIGRRSAPRALAAAPARGSLPALPAATILATGLPLVYYAALGRLDDSWGMAREAMKHSFSFWSIALALLPLALPALLGYRGRSRTFFDTLTRAWPLCALGIYLLSATSLSATPLHAFQGITIPLAVLAVRGMSEVHWRQPRRPAAAAEFARLVAQHPRLASGLAVALLTIPASGYELSVARQFMGPTAGNPNFIRQDERRAIDYLAHNHEAGGVLTRFYLGSVVPGSTGRRVFVGNCLWSQPSCTPRAQIVQDLFDGALRPSAARSFARLSGARFVLADCDAKADLDRELGTLVLSEQRFGCARVVELDTPAYPSGPLAEFSSHAAVRAEGR